MQPIKTHPFITNLAIGLGLLSAVGFVSACFLMIDRRSEAQMFGMLLGWASCVPCTVAILLSVWGEPLQRAAGLAIKRLLMAAAAVVALDVLSRIVSEDLTAARRSKNDAVAAEQYTHAKGYKHYAAAFDPTTHRISKLGCEPMANDCPQAFIIPFRDDGFLLMLSPNGHAHVFDGTASVRVGVQATPTNPNHEVHEGRFTYRGKTYRFDGMHNADFEYLRPVGSQPPYVNSRLLETIAPLD